jgi:hypothetical protein
MSLFFAKEITLLEEIESVRVSKKRGEKLYSEGVLSYNTQ